MLHIIFFLLMVVLGLTQPSEATAQSSTFSPGGTVYVVYDLGRYGTDPTAANMTYLRSDPGAIRSVLMSYDLNPTKVRDQLIEKCNVGQKKIALNLYFYPFASNDGAADSRGGVATSKVQENIKNVTSLIFTLANEKGQRCFDELQFRFVQLGAADPGTWAGIWKEDQYRENLAFITNIRNLVKSTVGFSSIALYFDLGLELGGRDGQNHAYIKRLWKDYTSNYGTADTYGFSLAWNPLIPGKFKNLISAYDSVGKRPTRHAVDVYDTQNTGIASQLTALYGEMKETGEQDKPLLIQETYFSDQQTFRDIQSVINKGVNVYAIMQWQVERDKFYRPDGQRRSFSTIAPTYLYLPSVPSAAPRPGDFNNDGKVDDADYNLLIANFGKPYTIFDYNFLVANYGK